MLSGRAGVGLVIVVAAALALSACGRRGALQPPPQAGAPPVEDTAPADSLVTLPAPGARPAETAEPPVPERAFILDALL